MNYLDNICTDTPLPSLGYRYANDLAGDVRGVIELVAKQEAAVRVKPMDDFNLQLWISAGCVSFMDGRNEPREDDHVLPLVYGSAICDVAESLKNDPLIIALMALIDVNEHTTYSDGVRELIINAKALIVKDVAARALQRHTPANADWKLARDMVANDNSELVDPF